MADEPSLMPVTSEDLLFALAFGLQFRSRNAKPQVAGMAAQITASHLIEYLDRAGFVVMRKPT